MRSSAAKRSNPAPAASTATRVKPILMQNALRTAHGLSRQGHHVGMVLVLCTDNRTGEAHSEPPPGHRGAPATYENLIAFTHSGSTQYVAEGLRQLRDAGLVDVTKTRLGSNVLRWTDAAIALQNALAREDGPSAATSASAHRRTPIPAGEGSSGSAAGLAPEASPRELAAVLEHAAIVDTRDAGASTDIDGISFATAYLAVQAAYEKLIPARHPKRWNVRPAKTTDRVRLGGAVLALGRDHRIKLKRAAELVVAAYLARSNARLENERHPLPWLVNDLGALLDVVRADLNAEAFVRQELAHADAKANPTTLAGAPFEDGEGGIDLDALGFTKGRAA